MTVLDSILDIVEELLENNELEQAINALLQLDQVFKAGMRDDILLHSGNWHEAEKMFKQSLISFDDYSRATSKARFGLIDIMGKDLSARLSLIATQLDLKEYLKEVPSKASLGAVLDEANIAFNAAWLKTVAPETSSPIAEPVPNNSPAPPIESPKVLTANGVPKFIALYDVADKQYCDRLNNHLFVLRNTKKIQIYYVHKAAAGEDVEARAKEELLASDYVLALITPNFFSEETPWFAMTMDALAQGRKVIPIRMQKMDINGTGLERLRPLPNPTLTVAEYANPDAAYAEIAAEIGKIAAK